MPVLVIFLFFVLTGSPAQAGAWMREKATSFVSSTFTLNRLFDHDSGTYVEYGWHDDLTVGADLSFANNHLGLQSGAVTFFLRRPLGRANGANKWAYQVGAGTAWVQNFMLPHVMVGLSWGRSYEMGQNGGWMGVDGKIYWDVTTGRHAAKLDGTLGYDFSERTAGMLQVYLAHIEQQSYGTLAPSVLFRPKNRKFRIQIGTEFPFSKTSEPSLKLGLWREF